MRSIKFEKNDQKIVSKLFIKSYKSLIRVCMALKNPESKELLNFSEELEFFFCQIIESIFFLKDVDLKSELDLMKEMKE